MKLILKYSPHLLILLSLPLNLFAEQKSCATYYGLKFNDQLLIESNKNQVIEKSAVEHAKQFLFRMESMDLPPLAFYEQIKAELRLKSIEIDNTKVEDLINTLSIPREDEKDILRKVDLINTQLPKLSDIIRKYQNGSVPLLERLKRSKYKEQLLQQIFDIFEVVKKMIIELSRSEGQLKRRSQELNTKYAEVIGLETKYKDYYKYIVEFNATLYNESENFPSARTKLLHFWHLLPEEQQTISDRLYNIENLKLLINSKKTPLIAVQNLVETHKELTLSTLMIQNGMTSSTVLSEIDSLLENRRGKKEIPVSQAATWNNQQDYYPKAIVSIKRPDQPSLVLSKSNHYLPGSNPERLLVKIGEGSSPTAKPEDIKSLKLEPNIEKPKAYFANEFKKMLEANSIQINISDIEKIETITNEYQLEFLSALSIGYRNQGRVENLSYFNDALTFFLKNITSISNKYQSESLIFAITVLLKYSSKENYELLERFYSNIAVKITKKEQLERLQSVARMGFDLLSMEEWILNFKISLPVSDKYFNFKDTTVSIPNNGPIGYQTADTILRENERIFRKSFNKLFRLLQPRLIQIFPSEKTLRARVEDYRIKTSDSLLKICSVLYNIENNSYFTFAELNSLLGIPNFASSRIGSEFGIRMLKPYSFINESAYLKIERELRKPNITDDDILRLLKYDNLGNLFYEDTEYSISKRYYEPIFKIINNYYLSKYAGKKAYHFQKIEDLVFGSRRGQLEKLFLEGILKTSKELFEGDIASIDPKVRKLLLSSYKEKLRSAERKMYIDKIQIAYYNDLISRLKESLKDAMESN